MKGGKFVHGVFYFFLALLFGITLARGIYSGEVKALVIALVCFVLLSAFLIWKKKWKFLLIIFAFFFAGNGLFFAGTAVWGGKDYAEPVAVVGRVDDQLYDYGSNQVAILKDVTINGESARNVQLRIYNNGQEGVKSGEILSFVTNVTQSRLIILDGFNTYSFRNNIGYNATVSIDKVVATKGYLKLDEKYRLHIKSMLNERMDESSASVCYAMLFGDKQEIDEMVKNNFRDAGIVHILVVSGLHIGFLIACLYFLLDKLKANKYVKFIVAFILLLTYCFLCSFSPSVVRASVMGLVVLLARLLGRRYDRLTSLGIAGFIIVLPNPLSALDVGFLMSFFCVATIFFIFPVLTDLISKIIPRKCSEVLAMSISAQLGILPFLALFTESYNLLSVFANFVVIPLFSVMFPLLLLVMIICSIMPFMSFLFVPFKYFIDFITGVAKVFASSSLRVPLKSFGVEVVASFFIVLFACSRYLLSSKLVKGAVVACGLFSLTLGIVLSAIPPKFEGVDIVSDNSFQTMIITSDSGQRLMLGNLNKNQDYMLDAYFDCVRKHGIDYFVTDTTLSSKAIKYLDSLTFQVAMVPDKAKSSRNDIVEVVADKEYTLGDFKVKYIMASEKVLGIEINYSNHAIFFASSSRLSYNNSVIAKEYLAGQDYQMAVLGDNDDLSDCFDCNTIISKKGDTEHSFQKDGNMRFFWQDNTWKMKSLD